MAIGFAIGITAGCSGDGKEAEYIDYGKLHSIEVNLEVEIGESADFLPGNLYELILTSDGTMLVSDSKNNTIEQFTSEGEHVATIAEEGRGPGEISDPVFLFHMKEDTLLVRHVGMSNRIDYYSRDTSNIYRYIKSWAPGKANKRLITLIGNRSDSTFYAGARWRFQNLRQWMAHHSDYSRTPLAIVDKFNNILVDSLFMLKTPTPLMEQAQSGGTIVYGVPPYQYRDRFRPLKDGRYLIASADSSKLYIYDRHHELDQSIQLRIKERMVGKVDLDKQFELMEIDNSKRKKMKTRVPERKPPFLDIWVSQNFFWLHTDTGEEGKQIIVLDREREAAGTFFLSEFDVIEHVSNDRIYTLHKDPTAGHSIRIYQVDV